MAHRLFFMLLTAAALLVAPMVTAAEEYPYTAYVAAAEVDVRCGPSQRHYMTHRLFAGDEVQVYRREATGWLAIRPPEGSYSWIPADVTEETNDKGVYRVLTEIAAMIGSPDTTVPKHAHYQVKLRPGELVEVVGEITYKTAEGEEVWFKISPPAGEFRWIHIQQVSKSPLRDEEVAAARQERELPRNTPREYREVQAAVGTGVRNVKESLAALTALNAARREKPTQPAMELRDLNDKSHDDVRPVEHQQPINVARDYNASPDGFVKRKPRPIENTAGVPAPSSDLRMASREQMQNSIHGTPRTTQFNDLPNKPSLQPSGLTSTPIQPVQKQSSTLRDAGPAFDAASATEQLAKLDVELSTRVAQPRELWNLDPIRNQVQRIVDNGATPTERGQARLLLEKIRRFEETFEMPNDPILAARSKGGTASAADARYDGVGLLQPVLTRNGQTIANYALVDADGNPVAFVTPAPGMNLRRYENKPVGIYGKRGMIEKLNKPHLVAERIIELSTR